MNKLFYFFLFISTFGYCQVAGESIYSFLNVTGSARQAALGGNILTLRDDVNQPVWNPSVIGNQLDNFTSLNYVNYLGDVSHLSASYAHMITRNIGTVHASVNYMNYGKFIEADEFGNELGNFSAYDLAFSIGYSYNINYSDFYIGGNLKIINSVIDNYTSIGLGGDLGLLYYNEYKPYSVTLVVRNIGYQITAFDEERENLPTTISLGASYKLTNVPIKWHVTFDNLQKWDISAINPSNSITDINGNTTQEKISFLDNSFRHVTVGAELFYESAFNIRLGYNFKRSKEFLLVDKRTFAGFTAGFGLKMNKMRFNYAFSKYHPTSNSSTFSLQINLN